jgi:hypothetical protein
VTVKIRVEMVGGPLDGAVELREVPNGQFLDTHFVGPDPSRPQTHVIVYELIPDTIDKLDRKRMFSRELTNQENLKRGVGL